jgi:hypothetical protein
MESQKKIKLIIEEDDEDESVIDKTLTEIDIFKLIDDIGIPFEEDVSDEDIDNCLEQNILLTPNSIYNGSRDKYSYRNNEIFDVLKISTIVNEIKNNTYNYNFPIPIWHDDVYSENGEGLYHIRAFYYCKKNMYVLLNPIDY